MHTCPRCGLTNPDPAVWCDCDYDFRSGQMREPPTTGMLTGAEAPKGIGSWLILFAIPLSVVPLLLLVALFRQISDLLRMGALFKPDHPYYSPWWGPLVFGEVLYMVAGLVASCWLAVLFFGRNAKFPRTWVRVNVLLATFSTLDASAVWLMSQQFADLWKPEEIIGELRSVFYAWIGLWIWSTYLIKSRRVRNTFVQ
jgi:hypothetical protein